MRRDPPPMRDVVGDFDGVRFAKQRPRHSRLARLRPYVTRRYCEYFNVSDALEGLPSRALSTVAKDALLHCYDSRTDAWDGIRTEFMTSLTPNARSLCPYCMVRAPGTLDHFLPKERFPEFAVLTSNLIYVCNSCNLRKGRRFVTAPRAVLNPYFDEIPENSLLLYAGVSIVKGTPCLAFSIAGPSAEIRPALSELAQRHFEAFDLNKLLIAEGSDYVGILVREIVERELAAIDSARLAKEINVRRAGLVEASVNDWRLALLDAIDDCPGFLGYVNASIATRPVRPAQPPRPRRDPAFALLAKRAAAEAAG